MKASILVCALVAFALPHAQAPSGSDDSRNGWVSLFDGHSLRGWTPEQGAKWRVENGAIVGDAGDDGWLRSERQFGDFTLRIQFKNTPNGNSGVFLRTTQASNAADPSNPAGGYELQINNDDSDWATGSIENFIQRLVPVNPAPGQWHSYEVSVRGDRLTATLDGVKVLDGSDARFKIGYIGLQHHKGNAIAFRDIKIQSAVASGRHLIRQIPVPGDYGWDYASADTEGRRLYLGHVKEVTVLDLDTGAVVGSVSGGTNMHGAAVARPFNRGFISQTNPESGSVVIFDLKTLARIGEVTVGKDPNLILFDRKTGRVFTADRGDSRVSAIDAKDSDQNYLAILVRV